MQHLSERIVARRKSGLALGIQRCEGPLKAETSIRMSGNNSPTDKRVDPRPLQKRLCSGGRSVAEFGSQLRKSLRISVYRLPEQRVEPPAQRQSRCGR